MRLVFVVDESAQDLCSALNETAIRDGADLQFKAVLTPTKLIAQLAECTPDLVLLHHNWEGIGISKLLDQLAAACDKTRVIVFTGQAVKIAELIECVRNGVADYWTRDQMSTKFIFRQASYYCSSQQWQVSVLKTSSGSVAQLAERAEKESELRRVLEQQRDTLTRRNRELESEDRAETMRDLRSGMKVILVIGALVCAFLLANTIPSVGPMWSLGFVALCGVIILFFEGKISFAQLHWKKGTARIQSNAKDLAKRR